MKWIPCSERLPREYSDDERVLATTDVDGLGVIIMPIYDVVSWYRKGYISAWMPLPKPYTADRKTEPTISKMEQVEPQTDFSHPCYCCANNNICEFAFTDAVKICRYVYKPQAERSE